MKTSERMETDPELDLVLERVVDVPPSKVWAAWTRPEQLVHWFTPAPWKTTHCEIDLRPGGKFFTVMRSPEGQEFPNRGCYLEVVPDERLVWTSCLLPGWRPAPPATDASCGEMPFTALLLLEPVGQGTRYTAIALHPDRATRDRHEQMGFHDGWGTCLDQLVAFAKER